MRQSGAQSRQSADERPESACDLTQAPRDHRPAAQVNATPAASGTPLAGGHLLAAISTSIVGILREHYGRGPMKAKTYALDDIIVVVMRGSGFTALEQTIMDSGEPERVIAMREDFQRVMAKRYKETIEELTGRKVLAFLSQAHVEPDITMEIFFVDGPLDRLRRGRDHRARRLTGVVWRRSFSCIARRSARLADVTTAHAGAPSRRRRGKKPWRCTAGRSTRSTSLAAPCIERLPDATCEVPSPAVVDLRCS